MTCSLLIQEKRNVMFCSHHQRELVSSLGCTQKFAGSIFRITQSKVIGLICLQGSIHEDLVTFFFHRWNHFSVNDQSIFVNCETIKSPQNNDFLSDKTRLFDTTFMASFIRNNSFWGRSLYQSYLHVIMFELMTLTRYIQTRQRPNVIKFIEGSSDIVQLGK